MSEIEKDWGSNTSIAGADILLDAAKPKLYRMNAFRVAELPVESKARDLVKRRQIIEMASKTGMPIPAGTDFFLPLEEAVSPDTLREAMQCLQDPERRLVDEFFWFWPQELGQSKSDKALSALSRGEIKAATEIWLNQEQSDESNVSIHNLAVLYHAMALDMEHEKLSRSAEEGPLEEEQRQKCDLYWQQAFRFWRMLLEHEAFWSKLAERIRSINDPRLTTGTVRRMQTSLPSVLLLISAHLALQYAERANIPEADRHKQLMVQSGFEQNIIDMALRRVIEPIRERIKLQCRKTETEGKADPIQAGNIARQLIAQTKPLLAVLDCLLLGGNPIRDSIHDEIALCAVACQIQFGNKTENWKLSSEILQLSHTLAISKAVKTRIEENSKIVRENADLGNAWCDEGYYDLPAPILTVLERAREQAKAGQWDKVIPLLKKMTKGEGEPRIEEKDKHLIRGPLAYCLNLRAMAKYNPAINQHNELPSVIKEIKKRKNIGVIFEPGKCMGCGAFLFERYMRFTFEGDTHVLCENCGKELKNKTSRKKAHLQIIIITVMNDLILAERLNPQNSLIRKNLSEVRRLAYELNIDLPHSLILFINSGFASITELIIALKDLNLEVREAAEEALVKIEPNWAKSEAAKSAIPLLAKALEGLKSPDVQTIAAQALGKLGLIAVPYLMSVLSNGMPGARKAVAEVLGNIGPGAKDAIPILKATLRNKNPSVCMAAKDALRKIGKSIPEVVDDLKNKNTRGKKTAILALAKALTGSKIDDSKLNGEAALAEALKDKKPCIRSAAAQALGEIGHGAKGIISGLLIVLVDENYKVRKSAALALGQILKIHTEYMNLRECEKVILALTITLKDKRHIVRIAVMEALAKIGPYSKGAIPSLIASLKDKNLNIRMAAAYTLGQILAKSKSDFIKRQEVAEVVSALAEQVRDKNSDVCAAAMNVLDKIDPVLLNQILIKQNAKKRRATLALTLALIFGIVLVTILLIIVLS